MNSRAYDLSSSIQDPRLHRLKAAMYMMGFEPGIDAGALFPHARVRNPNPKS